MADDPLDQWRTGATRHLCACPDPSRGQSTIVPATENERVRPVARLFVVERHDAEPDPGGDFDAAA